jgi:signal transduction histidine kinase
MGKSINQLHKTIYDLSEITKAQKEIKGDSEINIKEVINEVLGDIHHLVEDSNAVIEKDIQVENIYFNKSNLRSIVVNLLTNAIKYRSNERPLKIVITTLLSEKEILLIIEDNGLGISQRNQLKLFSMF